jgi:hypothetical protein
VKHRHLNHETWTLTAIDSCLGRGSAEDWAKLREDASVDRELLPRVLRVCTSRLGRVDPQFYDRPLYEEWKALG